MTFELVIEEFDANRAAPADVLSTLHSDILPTSPLVRLGRRFMQQFYYNVLPKHGYIFGAIARVNGEPAAFVVATRDSNGFIRSAVLRHWPRLAWECGMSLLTNPKVLKGVPEALTLISARISEWRKGRKLATGKKAKKTTLNAGEILSIGTRPDFQTARFLRESKLNLADELLKLAIRRLSEGGTHTVRSVVDADNKPAQFFYHCRGWKREAAPDAGWKVPVVEFIWNNSAM